MGPFGPGPSVLSDRCAREVAAGAASPGGLAGPGLPGRYRGSIGLLLLVGAVLYALPRSAFLGAIYLTAFLGGAVAAHVRIGSPLFTHILFGVYVAMLMWAGLVLRRPALLGTLLGRRSVRRLTPRRSGRSSFTGAQASSSARS